MEPGVLLFLQLAIVLAAAKLAGEVCERGGQPAVLGELVAGVLLGNLVLVVPSWTLFSTLSTSSSSGTDGLHVIGAIGVVLLLFEAGLETTVAEMRRVGASSILVAVVGICVPFGLGYLASAWLIPEVPAALLTHAPTFPIVYMHLFIGATLSATSVGITARVFKDLDVMQRIESRIVLGAAVIDDVIGLMILAIVNGVVLAASAGTSLAVSSIVMLCVTAALFLFGALVVGVTVVPRVVRMFSVFKSRGVMIATALFVCFSFAAASGAVGLAPIVGAFAAGLVLEEVHFAGFAHERSLRDALRPLVEFVAPVFFVLVGAQVNLAVFAHADVLTIGAALTAVAVAGKLVSGLVVRERPAQRWIVAFGMVPRGEVGLIFAGIGRASGVIDDRIFAAVVVVVVVTTLMTPMLLASTIRRGTAARAPRA